MSNNNPSKNTLRNNIALVTGGTRGIGLAIARSLLEEGVKVAICGTKSGTVDKAVRELGPLGEVFGTVADVSQIDQVKSFISAARDRFGDPGILVNNAGVGTFRSVAELSPVEWGKMIGLNLTGVYYCCHEILPIFKQRGGGDIINIGSLAGKNPFAGGSGYNASKFGLLGFSEAMMLDHRDDGVRVSCVMPGSVDTAFGGDAGNSAANWKIAPDDIAEVVVTLLKMPSRTTVSRVEIRPTRPPKKG
ncbi:MAG: SDR family oxidoreductase [Terriglobia bacterium]